MKVEPPDILLADAEFSDDLNAPQLYRTKIDKGGTIEKFYDPRGLAYGSIMTAYFTGQNRRRPFGFSPYSQDLSVAADNGHAISYYGVMRALAGQRDALTNPRLLREHLASTPKGQKPRGVLAKALEMFRSSLLQLIASRRYVFPVSETFERALVEIRGGGEPRRDLSVSWGADGDVEEFFLSSIFADFRVDGSWQPEKLDEIASFLEMALEGRKECVQWLDASRAHVQTLYFGERSGLGDVPRNWPEGQSGAWEKALTFTIMWALDSCRAKASGVAKLKPAELLRLMGFPPAQRHKVMNRALGRILGNLGKERREPEFRTGEYLSRLERSTSWPFPAVPDLPWLVSIYLDDLAREGGQGGGRPYERENRPDCLKAVS